MINIQTQIFETLEKMPVSLQEELWHYAEYLQEKYNQNNGEINTSNQKRRSGILKGIFVLPLADDFDEPLEDFEDYMT